MEFLQPEELPMAILLTERPGTPLRQRMLDDMAMRAMRSRTQHDYVRHVRAFAAFLGRSPDNATAETCAIRQPSRTPHDKAKPEKPIAHRPWPAASCLGGYRTPAGARYPSHKWSLKASYRPPNFRRSSSNRVGCKGSLRCRCREHGRLRGRHVPPHDGASRATLPRFMTHSVALGAASATNGAEWISLRPGRTSRGALRR